MSEQQLQELLVSPQPAPCSIISAKIIAAAALLSTEQLRARLELIAQIIGTEEEGDYPDEADIIIKELASRGALHCNVV